MTLKGTDIFLVFMLISISILAFLPHQVLPQIIEKDNPNFNHILAFFTISFYTYRFERWKLKNILFFIIAFGLYIEVFQGLFTTREFSLHDLLFDVAGYVIFLVLLFIFRLLKNLIRNHKIKTKLT